MKSWFSPVLLALIAFVVISAPSPARAQSEASFDFFYDTLHPYGEWIQVPDYGLCWRPTNVGSDWAPYTDGYWAYTDAGWTWVSYEDYGGIVYHYGRWADLVDVGWAWVPGYEWGPAWVSWRTSEDYVGWAPLPPEAGFQPEVGVGVWVDSTYDIGPGWYHFCGIVDFGAPVITAVLLPPERNIVIIRSTINVTNITVNNFGVPFVGGPRFEVIAARSRKPIPALKLIQETNVKNIVINRGGHAPVFQTVQRGNALIMPAPALRPAANPLALAAKYKPARVVTAKSVNKGWDMATTPADRDRLREKFKKENKGATAASAPARALQPADLGPVPQKVDFKAPSPTAGPRLKKPGETSGQASSAIPTAPIQGRAPIATPAQGGFPGGGEKPRGSSRLPVDIVPPKAPVAAVPEAPASVPSEEQPGRKLKPFVAPGAPMGEAKDKPFGPGEKVIPGEVRTVPHERPVEEGGFARPGTIHPIPTPGAKAKTKGQSDPRKEKDPR